MTNFNSANRHFKFTDIRKKKLELHRFTGFLTCLLIIILALPFSEVQAASPKLNKTKLSMYVGQTFQLKLKNAKADLVEWSGTNSAVTVFSNGKIKAEGGGVVNVYAKYKNKSYKCVVSIDHEKIHADDISLAVGEKSKIKVDGGKVILGFSSDREVAVVSSDGIISAVGKGKAKIEFVTAEHQRKTLTVSVHEPGKITSGLNCSDMVLYKGESFKFVMYDDVIDHIKISETGYYPYGPSLTGIEIKGSDTIKNISDVCEVGYISVVGKHGISYSVKINARTCPDETEQRFTAVMEYVLKNGTDDGKGNITYVYPFNSSDSGNPVILGGDGVQIEEGSVKAECSTDGNLYLTQTYTAKDGTHSYILSVSPYNLNMGKAENAYSITVGNTDNDRFSTYYRYTKNFIPGSPEKAADFEYKSLLGLPVEVQQQELAEFFRVLLDL